MEEKLSYFKLNAPYPVGVRFNTRDEKGRVLNTNDPYVAVEESKIRDFKRANMYAIINGLILATTEPDLDFDSPNMVDDEKAAELVKNVFILKKALAEMTSPTIVDKLLTEATLQQRPAKTIKLIRTRLAELNGDESDEDESPRQMGGVE
jgi:hypothetical protein